MMMLLLLDLKFKWRFCLEKVLIVDDSKFARKSIKNLLEKLDYAIVGEAVDGLDALEKYKELQPSLIVTDIEMPKCNGINMMKEIRSHDNDVKIVVVSSIVNGQVVQEVTGLNATLVKKPVVESRFVAAIKLLSK